MSMSYIPAAASQLCLLDVRRGLYFSELCDLRLQKTGRSREQNTCSANICYHLVELLSVTFTFAEEQGHQKSF